MVLLKIVASYYLRGMPFVNWPTGDAATPEQIDGRWITIFDEHFREAVEAVPVDAGAVSVDMNGSDLKGRREMADLDVCLGVARKNPEPRTPSLTKSPPFNGGTTTPGNDASPPLETSPADNLRPELPRFDTVDAGGCLGTLNEKENASVPPEGAPSAPNMMPPTPPSLEPPALPPPSPPPPPPLPLPPLPPVRVKQEVKRMSHLAPMLESAMYRDLFGSLVPGDL